MTTAKSPAEAVAEARDGLWKALAESEDGGPPRFPRLADARKVLEALASYTAAVRAEALAPREPSPELAEAERGLRSCLSPSDDRLPPKDCKVIAAELDRLRAEVARLTGEAQRLRGPLFNLKSLAQIQHILAEGKLYGRGDEADRLMRAAISAANAALAGFGAEGRHPCDYRDEYERGCQREAGHMGAHKL